MIRRLTTILIMTFTAINFAQGQSVVEIMALRDMTRANTPTKSMAELNAELRPHDINYLPDGDGPFPVVLFFHGCSGRTLSHEQDWAKRMNDDGIAMISVDSYSGRNINWEDACNFKTMIPWQRAADVFATIEHVKSMKKLDSNNVYLAGFSHGAMTNWAANVFASNKKAPISMEEYPQNGFQGVKGNFIFYGPCMEPVSTNVKTQAFLGDNDAYIDENMCINYQNIHPANAGSFDYTIYKDATHTFDHAKPNAANVEAGSVYDEAATIDAWKKMKEIMCK